MEYTMPGGNRGAWSSITCLSCLATRSALASGSGNIVVRPADRVVGGGELDAGHVPETHHLTVSGLANDDILEFSGTGQSPFYEHRILQLLPLGDRRQAEAAGGRDDVLLAYDTGNVGGGHPHSGHA